MKNVIVLAVASTIAAAMRLQAGLAPQPPAIVLENERLRAEIVPEWAGRLMFFGPKGGENTLWTQPEAAAFDFDQDGAPMWKNVGGEKTWVGSQGPGWRAFVGKKKGVVWPPPVCFDSEPFQVVKADLKSALLRSSVCHGGDWLVAIEREFLLEEDRLVIHQRLITKDFGPHGPDALPDDDRRLWSVAQVPMPRFVMMRMCGKGRHAKSGPIGEPESKSESDWATIGIPDSTQSAKICADGDALAVPVADGKWLLAEQTAPQRFLDAIVEPGRAMVAASPCDYKPSAYAELEFAAYGPDAEQTITFSICDTLPPQP